MPAAALTPHQLRLRVAEIHRGDPLARVIGLHAAGDWKGGDTLELDAACFAVVRADTVLEFREALDRAETLDRRTVVLSRLEQGELGLDVVARLASARLKGIDLWDGVKGLFKARQLDPSVRERCLAQALLEHVPGEGFYPPVPAGMLDAGTIWRTLFHFAFGMEDREPDLAALLRWAATGTADARYRGAAEELKAAARRRLEATLGTAALSIIDVVDSGHGRDALALAIVGDVVFADGVDEPALQAAAARLERFHRNRPMLQDDGQRLARAARDALDDLAADDPDAIDIQLGRADALLVEIQAAPFAHLGRLTPLAWESRLRRFAGSLERAIDTPGDAALAGCTRAIQEVEGHDLIRQRPRPLELARMAIRLLRWLRTPPPVEGDFGQLACHYRDHLAHVDRARDAISAGDDIAELTAAYVRLERIAADRRAEFNRGFAAALADWTASGSNPGEVLRVEDVLERVVAPAAGAAERVLVVVLDGLSWPIAHALLSDLRKDHWVEAGLPEVNAPPPPTIAAIPSVTEVSRASLLAGLPLRGRQDDEQRLFRANHSLTARCERNHPPVLFHKARLTEGGRGALRPEVSQAILAPENRVVGVVVNAVDDRLAGGDQIRDPWSIALIRPLGGLLQAARDSGRAVVLASDHGHVWHRDGPSTPQAEGGERWRPGVGEPGQGEIVLEGSRVRGPAEVTRVIVPWDESIRYVGPKNGYHGGATPQEMIAPLVLLVDKLARTPRLEPIAVPRPAWWDVTSPPPGRPAPPARPRVEARTRPAPGFLFPMTPPADPVDGTPAPPWLDRLTKSPVYQAQRQLARKFVPDDATVRSALGALDRQGGSLTPAALAQALAILPVRLDGLIAKLQRLLNLEGYEVLRLDRQRDVVELDLARLKRQFELEQPREVAVDVVSPQRRREIIDALRRGTVPQRGLDVFAVGVDRFEPALDAELKAVAEGGAGFKAVRGEYGSGKTFFARWLEERAKRAGFAASEVQISEAETPLHRLETVYRRAMERLSTADTLQGALRPVVDGWFYGLEEEILAEGRVDPGDATALAAATGELLEKRLSAISRVTPQFAVALRGYRRAQADGDVATAEGLIAWLAGQPHVGAGAKRAAGLKGEVDHFAALSFLQGLLTVLRDSGYAGLVLVLDEIETLQRVRGDVREKGLNALRQLIDEIDSGRFPGLYLVITGTPAFFDGPQGVRRLEPLAQRLHVDFGGDAQFDNLRAVQVRLPGFTHQRLVEVGLKIRDIYAQDASGRDRVLSLANDAYVAELAGAVTGDLGGKVGVTPRLFLKKLVGDVLDRIDQHPDFDPRQHYHLTVAEGELTRVERAARGAASVDDVELDT